jgi:ceramide glucosyltransferase
LVFRECRLFAMILADCAAAFAAIAAGVHTASVLIVAWRCGRRPPADREAQPLPPITLLRPVCGIEPFSAKTLASSFALDYPNYEIIFCVAQDDDPVLPMVRRLVEDHPQVSARLLVGEERFSVNPKLNNLAKGWRAARHPWITMIDSNVLLPPDALRRLVARWQDDVGAVCSMPAGSRPANFWAELECAFLNTHEARFQYLADAIGCGFAQGKTMLFRRDLVERGGGLRALAADPAEDAAATKLLRRRLGLRIRLVDRPFEQPLGRRGAAQVWLRQLRWARLRRNSFPLVFLPEILVGSAPPSLALALATAHWGFGVAASAVGGLIAFWFSAEGWLASRVGWHFSWRLPAAMLARDLLLPALAIAAWAGSDFVWHGTAMRAERDREFSEAANLSA